MVVETRNAELKLTASDKSELEVCLRSCDCIPDGEEHDTSQAITTSQKNIVVLCEVISNMTSKMAL